MASSLSRHPCEVTVRKHLFVLFLLLATLLLVTPSIAQTDAASFAASLVRYDVHPNIVYHTADNYEDRLDVYTPADASPPTPVVVLIHGGGWIEGVKESRVLDVVPFLQMGFAAVNVEYRLGRVARAPAAVEDCRCALHWVFANAKKYNFDPQRVVVEGGSAGGHLALITGMLTPAAGFDRECRTPDDDVWRSNPGTDKDPRVAAIVNWYGIADVPDELHGPNAKGYTVVWLGDQPDADSIAKRVSPMNYVSANVPPIITIHGDKDELVPYSQSVRLHKALDAAGVPNQLYTVPGGNHGRFSAEENQKIWVAIRQFLRQNVKGLADSAAAK